MKDYDWTGLQKPKIELPKTIKYQERTPDITPKRSKNAEDARLYLTKDDLTDFLTKKDLEGIADEIVSRTGLWALRSSTRTDGKGVDSQISSESSSNLPDS